VLDVLEFFALALPGVDESSHEVDGRGVEAAGLRAELLGGEPLERADGYSLVEVATATGSLTWGSADPAAYGR